MTRKKTEVRKLIKKVIEILQELKDRCLEEKDFEDKNLKSIYGKAINRVAERRGVGKRAIIDIPSRLLREYGVKETNHFRSLFKEWRLENSSKLKQILLEASANDNEHILIEQFFDDFTTESEKDDFLAEEFGYAITDKGFREGKLSLRVHLSQERNAKLVKAAKTIWKSQDEYLRCSICSFSFKEKYGAVLGEGFIEAHHKVPISQLKEETEVFPEDLVPVCSNCHRMIHRYQPLISFDEIRKQLYNLS